MSETTIEMPGEPLDGLAERIGRLLDLYPTRRAAASVGGVSTDQITRYAQGRSAPPFEVMARLALGQGISLDWLAGGTGQMRRTAAAEHGGGLPVIGLTALGDGWYQPRTLGVRLPPPSDPRTQDPVAVLASDDSLLPEGVRPGHVCFAFGDMDVLEGDLAYVVRSDGMAALRRFEKRDGDGYHLSWFEPGGDKKTEILAVARVERLCAVVKIRRKW